MPVQIGATSSTFSDPIGLMSDCHRRIEMFMRTLSRAAEFEGRRLSDDESRALDAALRYFREAAPKHNADEEESLFPRLRALPHLEVQRALADLDRLEQEHRWAAPLHMEIDRLGQQWLSNRELGTDEIRAFQTAIRKLAAMYNTHIHFEESALFPLAARVLSPAQTTDIAREMANRRNVERGAGYGVQVYLRNAYSYDRRDPEDRTINGDDPSQVREKMLDKTIADSFPASDPPSSEPAPGVDPFTT
jgi:hemerythrin-like domain-containing protein